MGLVEELGSHIATASTRFVLGTSLFLNNLPDEPNAAASIIEYGGSAPDYVFANSLPVNENQRVQIVCRSTSSQTARTNIGAAWVASQTIVNQTVGSGATWLRATPVQSPFLVTRDSQGRVLYGFNLACTRRTTST